MQDLNQCQPFLIHLRAEHERLRGDIGEIELALTGRSTIAPQKILESLLELRDDLVRHFEEEERGGCIEEAASRCPRLSRQAMAVDREHPELLQRVRRLIERVGGSQADIDERFAEDFRQFAKELHEHEAAENRILKEAFGCGSEDDF